MIAHPLHYCEMLTEQDVEKILDISLHVLETKGLLIHCQEACRILAEAGADTDFETQKVRFPREVVLRLIDKIPYQWTLHARNPQRNVLLGNSTLSVVPGYGSAFVADSQGQRREAQMCDFENFALLACCSEAIDITGGLLVEPNDIQILLRPMEITYALIKNSDKPFMGSVAGRDGACDSIEMCKILFGDISDKACMTGLININSPLRLDASMADALLAYAHAGQPVLLTPGIMMGINAPVTPAGAIVQAFAELLGCAALVEAVRPGSPVILGLGGFGSDLRNASTGFGRPENALGIQLGSQIARHLHIPFRCSASVTGARVPDCRSGYERMMTALTAYHAGAHFCLQAAGILDCINMMSYEQFIIDIEIWNYIKHLARPVDINEETIGLDVIGFQAAEYLAHDHTLHYMRDMLFVPSLVKPDTYEEWWSSNGRDIVLKARTTAQHILQEANKPPLDKDIDKELQKYIAHRKKVLKCTA